MNRTEIARGGAPCQMAAGSIAAAYYYPPELRATAVRWFNGVGCTGAIVGPLALAALMNAGWTGAHILGILAVPMLIAPEVYCCSRGHCGLEVAVSLQMWLHVAILRS